MVTRKKEIICVVVSVCVCMRGESVYLPLGTENY